MAKTASRQIIYRPAPAPKVQVVRVSSPKPAKRAKRRASGGGGGGAPIHYIAAGGLALGLLEKADLGLPTIPLLGKTGTLALGLYVYSRMSKSRLARDLASGAAAVAAYQLARDGGISG